MFFFCFILQGAQINEAACDLAREVANEGDALVAGGVSQTPSYLSCKSKADVKAIFRKQLDVFIKKNVDFLIAEVATPNALAFFKNFSGGFQRCKTAIEPVLSVSYLLREVLFELNAFVL